MGYDGDKPPRTIVRNLHFEGRSAVCVPEPEAMQRMSAFRLVAVGTSLQGVQTVHCQDMILILFASHKGFPTHLETTAQAIEPPVRAENVDIIAGTSTFRLMNELLLSII